MGAAGKYPGLCPNFLLDGAGTIIGGDRCPKCSENHCLCPWPPIGGTNSYYLPHERSAELAAGVDAGACAWALRAEGGGGHCAVSV